MNAFKKTFGYNFLLSVFCLLTFMAANAFCMPQVSYTTSGSAGNWTLDFSVTNNLGLNNNIYYFGVNLPADSITGVPTDWTKAGSWILAPWGGSNTPYANSWGVGPYLADNNLKDGQTLSGFDVLVTADLAPTSVQWFAVAYGGIYTGDDHVYTDGNPIFEGVATNAGGAAPVPEPSTILLLGAGLSGLAFWRRKQK